MINLSLKLPGNREKEIVTRSEVVTIGRAPGSTVVLGDDYVSWQHGEITLRDGRYWYHDLRSTNGSVLLRGDKRVTLGETSLEEPLEVGDILFIGSKATAIVIRAIAEEITVGADFGTPHLVGEQIDPRLIEESLWEDNESLRCLIRLARSLCEIHDPALVKRHLAETSHEVFHVAHRAVVFDSHGEDFEPVAVAPMSSGQPTDKAIAKSVSLLTKVVTERRGMVYVVLEDSIRALASGIHNLAMRESALAFLNNALLCCPLAYGDDSYGVIQIESGPHPRPDEAFSRRDLALATMLAYMAAGRIHDLEHEETQFKLQRKATVGAIISWIGHDLGNLLQTPMMSASVIPILLRDDRKEELKTVLLRNRACIEVMSVILREITDIAKDPSEKFRQCDLLAELNKTVEYLRQIDPEHLRIEVRADSPMPAMFCDPVAIQRLVLNLALNSADAIAESNRSQEGIITVTCRCPAERNELVLEIKDNGPGIPPDILSEMRFIHDRIQGSKDVLHDIEQLAEKSKSRKMKKGRGLGFLFACQTVKDHKGAMDIETGPSGTTFTIRMPRTGGIETTRRFKIPHATSP
jgi:signal transduction histidine kinase